MWYSMTPRGLILNLGNQLSIVATAPLVLAIVVSALQQLKGRHDVSFDSSLTRMNFINEVAETLADIHNTAVRLKAQTSNS